MLNANTIDVLRGAKYLLQEMGWTQGANARDADGAPLCSGNPAATCFCLLGALRASAEVQKLPYSPARIALGRVSAGDQPMCFSDDPGRTVEEVIALLDRAIEAQS